MHCRITVVATEGKATYVSIELNGKKYIVRPESGGILVLCNKGIEAHPTIIVNDVTRCIAIR